MSRHKDHKRILRDQIGELTHPIRLRILELAETDPRQSLTASALASEMADLDVNTAQVAYHLARLQDAGLLPGRGR